MDVEREKIDLIGSLSLPTRPSSSIQMHNHQKEATLGTGMGVEMKKRLVEQLAMQSQDGEVGQINH
jgi:hypothetical protein